MEASVLTYGEDPQMPPRYTLLWERCQSDKKPESATEEEKMPVAKAKCVAAKARASVVKAKASASILLYAA